jgi:sporulation-control protein
LVFKQLLAAMGVGGPSVETVLRDQNIRPGMPIQGDVHIMGGDDEYVILGMNVALAGRVEGESGSGAYSAPGHTGQQYAHAQISGAFRLAPQARHRVPFQLPVPWETPLTHMYGRPLPGNDVGVATELEVARAVDATDLDPVAVHPLPAQERLLMAFGNLGFQFRQAECAKGRIWGVDQELPFYQEIEFAPAPKYAHGISRLEVTFVAGPTSMEVVLELARRSEISAEGHDSFGRFTVEYAALEHTDWEVRLDGFLQEASQRRGFF